ncbi:hypothetical protein K1T71_007326 [Dendrolimus kikuchii]|uniref:Uncharacterized protein n=1 Tax=Dendrolimus kikuchii TaxID=765133 RepID=A0ACC1D0F7_9NEOP|nr:hypothetical protein K1T71_007326 [Dendrolimus kikuchii]
MKYSLMFSLLPQTLRLHWVNSDACYNVTGARQRASALKVFAMWYTWTTLLLVSCALVGAAEVQEAATGTPGPAATATTTRAPPRTLDRQAAELAWRSWLQSPESGNQNAPPRRITTKSLFITPLVCPKGQRLDRNGCVQVVTVSKDEHERILLDKLNALFTSPPSGFNEYDYGDDELGPLQLSIPIGLDPQAAPLQGDDPSGQVHSLSPNNVKIDKKDENKLNTDASVEAELELLKLQNSNNQTALLNNAGVLNHDVLTNHYPEKPKRDSPLNVTDIETLNVTNVEGEKEVVFGHVNVDPVLYNTETPNLALANTDTKNSDNLQQPNNAIPVNSTNTGDVTITNFSTTPNENIDPKANGSLTLSSTKDQSKLNPENDYSDIGEAIKLISRYAEVTTDDNFSKDQKKYGSNDDNILGTRTKLQHRRNRPRLPEAIDPAHAHLSTELVDKPKGSLHVPKNGVYYRYPWPNQHSPTPPPDYPFRHIQDYWQGQNKVGGVYNSRGNPRRHHHSYTHSLRPHGSPYASYPRLPEAYPEQLRGYIHRITQHHANQMRSHTNNQDLYSLLGLRHWFSSESAAKR